MHAGNPSADIVGFYGWAALKEGKIKTYGIKLDGGAMIDSPLSRLQDAALDRTAELTNAGFPNGEGFWIVFYYNDLSAGKHNAAFYAIDENNKEHKMFSYDFMVAGDDTVVEDPAPAIKMTCVDSQALDGNILTCAGWTGANYKVVKFGYTVDGKSPVFENVELKELADDDPVKNPVNGGPNGVRFSLTLDVSTLGLKSGEHTVAIVAQLNDKDNSVLKIHLAEDGAQHGAIKFNYTAEEEPTEPGPGETEPAQTEPEATEPAGQQPQTTEPSPRTADAAVVAIAAVAAVALAGAFIAKKVR